MITRPRKLPWPASRIERDVLHSLWLEAQRTKQPITKIIKAAVDQHLTARLDEQPELNIQLANQRPAA